MTAGRITLLLTSPRVAPGLLAWPAWEVLRRARHVWTDDSDHPQATALRTAGITLEVAGSAAPAQTARRLIAEAATGADVVWLADADGSPQLHRALAEALAQAPVGAAEGAGGGPELAVAAASYDLPGARLLDLISVMDKLRARCPWVREQTHRSLVRYLVEEAYETVEAIESGERTHLREELGDLLFQVVFHARLAQEGEDPGVAAAAGSVPAAAGAWSIDDVAGDLVEKLIRRNPHVFGTAAAGDAADVENVWDQLKAEEKGRTSAVEGVPLALPALTLADKLLGRTIRSGLDVPVPTEPTVPAEPALPAGPLTADGLGDALLALVDRARVAGLDPEQALRDACRRYIAAVHAAEAHSPNGG